MGIASGPVVIGNTGISCAGRNEIVIGEPPNLAARLQAVAQPDTIIVSNDTCNLVQGDFKLKDVGLSSIRGYDKTQRPSQVTHKEMRAT